MHQLPRVLQREELGVWELDIQAGGGSGAVGGGTACPLEVIRQGLPAPHLPPPP